MPSPELRCQYETLQYTTEFSHFTILFLENLLDPGKVLWYIRIDIGCIWIVAVSVPVKRHNTYSRPAAHQRTPRITLWGETSFRVGCLVTSKIRNHNIGNLLAFSLKCHQTYLTESFLLARSTCTDNSGRKVVLPCSLTGLLVNKRHIHYLQLINNFAIGFCVAPSSNMALSIIFCLNHSFWKLNWLHSVVHWGFLRQLETQIAKTNS